MKRINWIPGLLLLSLLGCQGHMEYDTERLDPEVTLFEKGLVVPVGSAGPFSMELALGPIVDFLGNLGLSGDIMTVDEEGLLLLNMTSNLGEFNMYEVAMEVGDNDEPYDWEPDYVYGSPLMGMLMPMIGIDMIDQIHQVTVTNPFRNELKLNGQLDISCDEDYYGQITFEDVAIRRTSAPQELASVSLPNTCKASPSTDFFFSDLKVTLPAHFCNRINGDGIFHFDDVHHAHMAIGPNFELPLDLPLDVDLPLAQFSLKEVTVGVELESTVPLQISILRIDAKNEDDEVDENLKITPDILIKAGSPSSPATSSISMHIQSLDGSPIPDIHELVMSFIATGSEEFSDVLLSSRQGVSVKHASITISGGVTLFSHEQK